MQIVFSLGASPAPLQMSASQISKTPASKPLTWELIAIARSESRVASAIGCHKIGVALKKERKNEVSDSGLGPGALFDGRGQRTSAVVMLTG